VNHPTPEKQIGKRIAELRAERKLSQAKLAELMKAHPSGRYANWRQGMIDKTERGLRPLRVNEIADIADVLGVPPDLLLAPVLPGVDVDAAGLDQQIAETEAKLQAASKEHQEAWARLHEVAADQAAAQVDLDQAGAQVAYLQATLTALQRARGRQDPGPVPVPAGTAEGEMQPVVAAIVTSDLGVLVGRRNDGKPPWTFIAGEQEPGEPPEVTAEREVKEEATLEVQAGDVIGERVHPATGRTMIYLAARPVRGTDVFVGDEAELAEVRWVGLPEAIELLPGMFEPVREHLARELGEGEG
jgi:8-oxo-dGTP pyrophosphatase MutT (NUDIX family)/transcriptional regulator with XRE-family HTH domain